MPSTPLIAVMEDLISIQVEIKLRFFPLCSACIQKSLNKPKVIQPRMYIYLCTLLHSPCVYGCGSPSSVYDFILILFTLQTNILHRGTLSTTHNPYMLFFLLLYIPVSGIHTLF